MLVQVVKSKIHRVKVTGADLNYVGSVTIDEDLMDAANIIEGERIQIVNNNKQPNQPPEINLDDESMWDELIDEMIEEDKDKKN